MHVADLLDPLRRRMVRRVRAARDVVAEERHRRIDVVQLVHPVDGVIRHRGGQVPLRIADIGIDRRGVAEQVRLPLARCRRRRSRRSTRSPCRSATGRTVRPGSPDPGRRVVVLAEPGRAVAVLQQDAADRGAVLADDAVVAGEAGRRLGDDAEADRVVVAAGDQRRPRRRAQRGRVEVGVAQPVGGDAVQRRRRDDAAEGGRRGEADVVGHDQQDVRRALRRHDARRPGRLRLRGVEVRSRPERLRRRREVAAVAARMETGERHCILMTIASPPKLSIRPVRFAFRCMITPA